MAVGFLADWMHKLARTPHEDGATTLPIPEASPPPSGRRGYHVGAQTGRLNYGQRTVGVGPNAVTYSDLTSLRARSRSLSRNSGYGRKAVDVLANALVGDGIRPQVHTGSEAVDRRVEALWAEWAADADADGRCDVYGLQRLAVEAWLESGEVLLRRRPRRIDSPLAVPLQIQALESDFLVNGDSYVGAANVGSTDYVNQGVVFNRRGERVGYIVYRTHPGDYVPSLGGITGQSEVVRVNAANISHVYDTRRPGQVRGLPWAASVIEDLVALDEYMYNEAIRQETQSNFAAFVIGADQEDNQGLGTVSTDSATGDYFDTLQPGMVRHLSADQDIKFALPNVSPQLDAYSKTILRKIATGYRMPYELLTGDLSGVNFSSIRTGMLEFYRMIDSVRPRVVERHVCRPIWGWFIQSAIAAGKLPARDGGYPVTWHAPRPVPIDRQKEINADVAEVNAGVQSLSGIIRSRGGDPSTVFGELEADKARLQAMGINTSSVLGTEPGAVEVVEVEDEPETLDADEA